MKMKNPAMPYLRQKSVLPPQWAISKYFPLALGIFICLHYSKFYGRPLT